jgi:hypothetical protein
MTQTESMETPTVKRPEELRPVQLAPEGIGPLLQRDFVAVIAGSALTPEQAALKLRRELPLHVPEALVRFTRSGVSGDSPLQVGDTMHVRLKGSGAAAVLVSHVDSRSITLRTMDGHIEAGRNTFGFYNDAEGRLVCRVRSRARVRDLPRLFSYWLGGKGAQSTIWTQFLEHVAAAVGGELVGGVREETTEVRDSSADAGDGDGPTFDAFNPPPQLESERTTL